MQKYHIVASWNGMEIDTCDTLKRAYILAMQYARMYEETIDIFLSFGNVETLIDYIDFLEI